MGLDIYAYEKVGKFLHAEEQHWFIDEPHAHIRLKPTFAIRAPEFLQEGYYKSFGKTMIFRAGTYSAYNRWREWLSETFLEVKPKEIWEDEAPFRGRQFVELINFSDSEGTLGREVCKKLLVDFDEAVMPANTREDEILLFNEFHQAFKLASPAGAVVFA